MYALNRKVVTCSASSIMGIENFGDQLLTSIYARWIREADAAVTVSHLRMEGLSGPDRYAKGEIAGASFVLFTGGGYFADGDVGGQNRMRTHLRALRNLRVYGGVFKTLRRHGIPYAVMGLEVGPLVNPLYRATVRKILQQAAMVVVRNTNSWEHTQALCGSTVSPFVHLDAALTVSAEVSAGSVTRNPLATPAGSDGSVKVGFHIHSAGVEHGGPALGRLIERVKSAAPSDRRLRLFYLHDQRKLGRHPQRSFNAEQMILGLAPEAIVVPYRTPESLLAVIGQMDAIITTKLHVGVVARALGVPVIALGGHPKVRRFYQEIGEEDVVGTAEAFGGNGLPDRVQIALSNSMRGATPIGVEHRASAQRNRDRVHEAIATASRSSTRMSRPTGTRA